MNAKKTMTHLGSVALLAMVFLSASARAGCHVEFQGINSHIVCDDNGGGGPGISYSTINVHNACNSPIFVAVNYMGMRCQDYPGNQSCLEEFIPDSQLWGVRGWFKLAPGQTSYIGDTKTRNVYFYAETVDSQTPGPRKVWAGNSTFVFQGRTLSFIAQDTGGTMTQYTQNFTCN